MNLYPMNLPFFDPAQRVGNRHSHAAWIFAMLAACSGDPAEPEVRLLDPSEVHYGKSYAEWAADWVQYIYKMRPPDCHDPIKDTTGVTCAIDQDPESPVFFLVGTYGGPVTRTECTVPNGKPLFFPLINVWGDNAGLDPDHWLSDADIKATVEADIPAIEEDSLELSVDGQLIEDLERTIMREAAPYRLTLPEGSNAYTCLGSEGVVGDFNGYVTGAWAMLPPLPPGEHHIEFRGVLRNTPHQGGVVVQVRYDLTIE